jgi:hypothetical protein
MGGLPRELKCALAGTSPTCQQAALSLNLSGSFGQACAIVKRKPEIPVDTLLSILNRAYIELEEWERL